MSQRVFASGVGQENDYTAYGPKASPPSGEITGAVGRALAELPEMYADVLRMTYGEMLNASEIAELTGLDPGTVRTRRMRALEMLRDGKPAKRRPNPDDMRYSRQLVQDLLPYATDPEWDGTLTVPEESGRRSNRPPNEGGNGLVMVLDIRRAMAKLPRWVGHVLSGNRGEGTQDDAITAVLDFLNGYQD